MAARAASTTSMVAFIVLSVIAKIHGSAGSRCDGIPGGTLLMYDDPNQCNRYYACQHETVHEWYCPPGEFFSPRNQQCESSCPVERDLWCAGVPDGVFIEVPPNEPPNCQRYYTCFGGNMFPNMCPTNFVFSQIDQACIFNTGGC